MLRFGTGAGITWGGTPGGVGGDRAQGRAPGRPGVRDVGRAAGQDARVNRGARDGVVWVDGRVGAADEARCLALDHGLTVGDGVFET